MISFLRWLFWCGYYSVRRRPTDFGDWLQRSERRWAPWKKFRANVFRNDAHNSWEIYLRDERSHELPGVMIVVDVQISNVTGSVVGLTVYDHDLEAVGLKSD